MAMDSKESMGTRLTSEFRNYTLDGFMKIWNGVIGESHDLVREKQIKVGNKAPMVDTIKMKGVKIWAESGDDEEVLMTWCDENDVFKRLKIKKDDFVGVEIMDNGERAVVVMKSKKDPIEGKKQIIRKYYRES